MIIVVIGAWIGLLLAELVNSHKDYKKCVKERRNDP